MLKLIKKASAALAVVLSLAAGVAQAESSPVLDRVLKEGVLRVGMTGDQPPLNAKSRRSMMIGYEVDLANALASAMGVQLEIVEMPFGELLAGLDKKKVDMVMSGVAITPKRAQDYHFVGPYMVSGKSILTSSIALSRATQSGDINRADLKLAALSGSTSEEFIKAAAPEAEFVPVNNYEDAVNLLVSDSIDGLVADMPACALAVMRYPEAGLATLRAPLSVEPIGIAVPSKDPAFARTIDQYLETYERLGLLDRLRKKWFEDQSWIAALP